MRFLSGFLAAAAVLERRVVAEFFGRCNLDLAAVLVSPALPPETRTYAVRAIETLAGLNRDAALGVVAVEVAGCRGLERARSRRGW